MVRSRAGRLVLVLCGVAAIVAAAQATGSLTTTLEVAAVVAVLIGAAVAFGALDRSGTSSDDEMPDERTMATAGRALDSLDRIEHRRLDLGTPWPQLLVGPTGVAVVEVCDLDGPLVVGGTGVRRADDRHPCARAVAALEASETARRALGASGQVVPVRTILAVPPRTQVTLRLDSPQEMVVVPVDELVDALVRGPVLPMGRVDAAFALLARTVTVADEASARR